MLAGVDGCHSGWVAVVEAELLLTAYVLPDWSSLMARLSRDVLVGVDIPIGLPTRDSRQCDIAARSRLGRPRGSSVFPAPVRGVLRPDRSYLDLSNEHQRIDGRRLSWQVYGLLPKIFQVDAYLRADIDRQNRVSEVHPEVSFSIWNRGKPMTHRKSASAGRAEREHLIDREWPGARARLWQSLVDEDCERHDLNDAFAALWTVRRIALGKAQALSPALQFDAMGLRMEITA